MHVASILSAKNTAKCFSLTRHLQRAPHDNFSDHVTVFSDHVLRIKPLQIEFCNGGFTTPVVLIVNPIYMSHIFSAKLTCSVQICPRGQFPVPCTSTDTVKPLISRHRPLRKSVHLLSEIRGVCYSQTLNHLMWLYLLSLWMKP